MAGGLGGCRKGVEVEEGVDAEQSSRLYTRANGPVLCRAFYLDWVGTYLYCRYLQLSGTESPPPY
jgi:hypothetical protein